MTKDSKTNIRNENQNIPYELKIN